MMFLPTWMQKSPRMVPGFESAGLVSPSMTRPVLTMFKPSQTMQTTGPDAMYLTNPGKKLALRQISVVLLEQNFSRLNEFQCNESESFSLETLDDVTDKAALDTIGLDHQVSAFLVGGHFELE